jgi:hypothetical protein
VHPISLWASELILTPSLSLSRFLAIYLSLSIPHYLSLSLGWEKSSLPPPTFQSVLGLSLHRNDASRMKRLPIQWVFCSASTRTSHRGSIGGDESKSSRPPKTSSSTPSWTKRAQANTPTRGISSKIRFFGGCAGCGPERSPARLPNSAAARTMTTRGPRTHSVGGEGCG